MRTYVFVLMVIVLILSVVVVGCSSEVKSSNTESARLTASPRLAKSLPTTLEGWEKSIRKVRSIEGFARNLKETSTDPVKRDNFCTLCYKKVDSITSMEQLKRFEKRYIPYLKGTGKPIIDADGLCPSLRGIVREKRQELTATD